MAAVKAAAAKSGGNLRAVGRGNSWTPIFFDNVPPQLLLYASMHAQHPEWCTLQPVTLASLSGASAGCYADVHIRDRAAVGESHRAGWVRQWLQHALGGDGVCVRRLPAAVHASRMHCCRRTDEQGSPLVRVAPGVTAGELSGWTDANHVGGAGSGEACSGKVGCADWGTALLQVLLNYSALPTQTVTIRPRLAGIISTGSHGKGHQFGAIADFVHSLKIVQGNGEVVEYNSSHPRFNEAR